MSDTMHAPAFFIMGSKRGGTTLLRLMLNRHSGIAVPPESHFIIPLTRRFSPGQMLSRQDLKEAAAIVISHPRFSSWKVSGAAVEMLSEKLATPGRLADFISGVFTLQLASTGKSAWGEKTPEYIDIIPELQQLYPGAKFICLSRDGRDVSASLKAQGWEGWTVYQRARYWQRCISQMQELQQHLPAQCLMIRYEDLVLQQQQEMEKITTFLGLPYEAGMLDFNNDFAANITALELQHGVHNKLHRKPVAGDVYRWQENIKPAAVWKFEAVAYAGLKAMGYPINRYNPQNLLHQVTRMLYLPLGALLVLVYKLYHGVFSTTAKRNLRQHKAWTTFRSIVRRA